jgi:putative membrane protein
MDFSHLPAPPPASPGRLRLAQGLVLLFHITGFVGLAFSQDKEFYLKYTPLTLLLTAGLLIAFQPGRTLAFWLLLMQVFLLGLVAEVVGTNTGILFGHYNYGVTLGPQYMGAPWLIGLNWVTVTYLGGILAAYLPASRLVRVLVGAVLMVGFDLCLEPVASRYDFWHWTGGVIPMKNFRDWFLLALLLQVLFVRTPFPKRNPLVPLVYLVQLLFFFGLSLLNP